jgi:phospholipid/cholesterol/gamma-HCH transport system substrate-binding protein
MRRSAIGHEITVGWFIVAALVLLAGGLVLKTRSRGLLASTHLKFQLDHGKGLRAGSPVQIQGIPVGEVSDVELTPENRVLVTASIANRYAEHIYSDAAVTVVESPLGFSATKVSIDPGISQVTAATEQLLEVQVTETLMDQIAVIQSDVRIVIRRLDRFVAKAEESIDQFQTLAGRIERQEGLAGQLIGDPQLADDVRTTAAKLKSTATRFEAEVLDEAVAAIADARALVSDLRDKNGDLNTLIRDSDDMILSVKDAIEQARVAETSASLRDAAAAMSKTATRMDVSEDTRDAMQAMRKASESFEALSRALERQPDSVIFGRPTAASPGIRR